MNISKSIGRLTFFWPKEIDLTITYCFWTIETILIQAQMINYRKKRSNRLFWPKHLYFWTKYQKILICRNVDKSWNCFCGMRWCLSVGSPWFSSQGIPRNLALPWLKKNSMLWSDWCIQWSDWCIQITKRNSNLWCDRGGDLLPLSPLVVWLFLETTIFVFFSRSPSFHSLVLGVWRCSELQRRFPNALRGINCLTHLTWEWTDGKSRICIRYILGMTEWSRA